MKTYDRGQGLCYTISVFQIYLKIHRTQNYVIFV